MELLVTIRDKIADYKGNASYVCGNSDFVIHFDMDEEWAAHETKTARFVKKDGTYQDQVFTGNICPVPVISNTWGIMVGVFAGNLHTTTSAYIPAKKSILCASGMPSAPSDDVYAQIMQKIDDGLLKGEKGDKGEPGEPGKDGEPGEKGEPGEPGKDAEPYTLPTASAEVKGGVQVGKGLQMDGDVLGVVPESGMVLIEKITVGEEVVEISRNKEPDGTLYNFSAVTIRAKFPPSDKTGNLSIFFSFKRPAEIRSYMLNPYHATQERNGYSKCYLSNKRWRGGWWTCVRNEGEYAQYYENPVLQEQFGVEDGYLSKVCLNHVNGIATGTTIEIWGVRADA